MGQVIGERVVVVDQEDRRAVPAGPATGNPSGPPGRHRPGHRRRDARRPAGEGRPLAAGGRARDRTGTTPWTELVTNTSLASSSRRMRSGVSRTARPSSRAIVSTAALVPPGSSLPPAGGVCTTPSITANTLAR